MSEGLSSPPHLLLCFTRGRSEHFLTYEHPQGLSLAEDFETLLAAIEIAAYLRRRVVPPNPATALYGNARLKARRSRKHNSH